MRLLLQSLLLVLLITVGAFSQAQGMRRRGTWSSGGGGGGVACFQTPEQAQRAQSLVNEGQALPEDLIKAIVSINVLERWEAERFNPKWAWLSWKGRNWQEIDHEVMSKMARIAPMFAYRLQQASDIIKVEEWDSSDRVDRLYDATPEYELPQSCAFVQLAYRLSNGNNSAGQGPVRKLITAVVILNSPLFNLLPSLDQAMLVQHERMYLLGQAVGHNNSDTIRDHLRIQFMADFPFDQDNVFPWESNDRMENYRVHLTRHYGDWPEFFSDDVRPATIGRYSSKFRFNAFLGFLRKTKQRIATCNQSLDIVSCKNIILSQDNMEPWLNDDEAFLYIAHYFFDTERHELNSDFIMNPLDDTRSQEISELTVDYVCGQLHGLYEKKTFANKKLLRKGMNYCVAYEKSVGVQLTPRE